MKPGSEILVVLLSVSVFLLLLFIFVLSLPRLFQRKEPELKYFKPDAVEGAFRTLGDEIKSLKEQLILKERLAALGEISAAIAHEFRNPMGVIAGYARLLMKNLDETDKRREAALGILKEIEEMDRVMEELLKFRNSEPLNKVSINLVKSIEDVIIGMAEATSRIIFSWNSPVMITGDETLLKQAIRNLIQNALDAGNKVWINIEMGEMMAGAE
ncbi:MAG: histidine kinase dimerization/phospho-acceptor domain-containing protein [Thermodesulfovibrionales bacterium]|nr:histidine kinase dimerization/phospho-acceptor domain-containing protein [Thermodesulfovibrionales bacterium]